MTAPLPPRSIRWWSSARLRITAGITLTAAVVLTVVVLIAIQLLTLTANRAIDSRLGRETDDFTTFFSTGVIPSNGDLTPTPELLVRAYLAQQYPEAEVLLVGTATESGTQYTLSRYDVRDDAFYPAEMRSDLQAIGLDDAREGSGVVDATIHWRKITAEGPHGSANLVVAINHSNEREDASRVARLLMITSAGGLLLTAFMAWFLAGRMLEPVRRIREAADTISADDLSRRVPDDGPDEIVALAETVNAMLERVEDAYSTQREFLDDAGHELRTPLTVVQGNLDLLPDDPDERAENMRIVQDELSRMTRIVEDLLTLARADRPDFLRPTPTDLSTLVIDVEAKIEVVADRDWTVLPYAEGEALLDPHRITQALLQFCSNAVRFTRPGDRIEIGCRIAEPGEPTIPVGHASGEVPPTPAGEEDGRRIVWCVRDQGPGIPEGEEESIFQRFHTARGQLRDGRGGTGLGLAIVATIARAHEGRAFAYNLAGGGADFCIVIPLVPAPVSDDAPGGPSEAPGSGESRDTA